ncbi:MAG: hypothetical protein R3332_09665 [Pseudohongiellaceae bacterium]|nr:hypothetical protein [Pseudohongiellaceae bacterium]
MVLSDPIVIFFLAIIVVVSLYVARFAQQQQEKNMVRLYRLAALDRRRVQTKDLIRALRAMDEQPELMRVLNNSLKTDLEHMQSLDPARRDLEAELSQAQKAAGQGEPGKVGEMSEERKRKLIQGTSFDSDREVAINRQYINETVKLLRRLHDASKLRSDLFESLSSYLAMLSVSVAVNSQLNMGAKALQYGDRIKALGCFRKAEVSLQQGRLSTWERAQKQKEIAKRTQELLDGSNDQQGLLLMAAGG